jgi:hypothetical protein
MALVGKQQCSKIRELRSRCVVLAWPRCLTGAVPWCGQDALALVHADKRCSVNECVAFCCIAIPMCAIQTWFHRR